METCRASPRCGPGGGIRGIQRCDADADQAVAAVAVVDAGLVAPNSDVAGVVESARRSLVQVRRGRKEAGDETIWHADGLALTNAYVVGNGPVEVALIDVRSLSARLLARTVKLDPAALAVHATDLPTISLGESRSIRPARCCCHWDTPSV